jgi:hypothetical protein
MSVSTPKRRRGGSEAPQRRLFFSATADVAHYKAQFIFTLPLTCLKSEAKIHRCSKEPPYLPPTRPKYANSLSMQRGPTPMTRLFFDLVGPDDRSFDFHGRYFRDPKDAHEHAQLLSLDLSCTDIEKWHHAEVQVRDAFGSRLFSVPIIEIAEFSAAA